MYFFFLFIGPRTNVWKTADCFNELSESNKNTKNQFLELVYYKILQFVMSQSQLFAEAKSFGK